MKSLAMLIVLVMLFDGFGTEANAQRLRVRAATRPVLRLQRVCATNFRGVCVQRIRPVVTCRTRACIVGVDVTVAATAVPEAAPGVTARSEQPPKNDVPTPAPASENQKGQKDDSGLKPTPTFSLEPQKKDGSPFLDLKLQSNPKL